jgi:NAD-dependent dihydropyrimidine dehydrogenase PreA subunit
MTKIILKFSDKQVDQPITSKIIIDLKVPLNILNANVTPQGGEILAEVPIEYVDRVVQAYEEKNVVVTIQKGIEIDDEKCIDCGVCYSICPVDAIHFKADYSIMFDEENCISCGLCVDTCPTRAIKV